MNVKGIILKVVLGVVIFFILMIPIFIFTNNDNKIKKYDELMDKIIDASEKYVGRYPELFVSTSKIKLGDLKDNSLIDDSIVNPKTNKYLSNETYVIVTNNGSNKDYDIKLYDIPSKENNAKLIIDLLGEKNMQSGISVRYEDPGIKILEGFDEIDYSIQYFLKGKEVNEIDSSRPKTYEVVYTALSSKGELAKIVRTVVVQ